MEIFLLQMISNILRDHRKRMKPTNSETDFEELSAEWKDELREILQVSEDFTIKEMYSSTEYDQLSLLFKRGRLYLARQEAFMILCEQKLFNSELLRRVSREELIPQDWYRHLNDLIEKRNSIVHDEQHDPLRVE